MPSRKPTPCSEPVEKDAHTASDNTQFKEEMSDIAAQDNSESQQEHPSGVSENEGAWPAKGALC
jgi:hypothetical protein